MLDGVFGESRRRRRLLLPGGVVRTVSPPIHLY